MDYDWFEWIKTTFGTVRKRPNAFSPVLALGRKEKISQCVLFWWEWWFSFNRQTEIEQETPFFPTADTTGYNGTKGGVFLSGRRKKCGCGYPRNTAKETPPAAAFDLEEYVSFFIP